MQLLLDLGRCYYSSTISVGFRGATVANRKFPLLSTLFQNSSAKVTHLNIALWHSAFTIWFHHAKGVMYFGGSDYLYEKGVTFLHISELLLVRYINLCM